MVIPSLNVISVVMNSEKLRILAVGADVRLFSRNLIHTLTQISNLAKKPNITEKQTRQARIAKRLLEYEFLHRRQNESNYCWF
jgi:hypothetical protein